LAERVKGEEADMWIGMATNLANYGEKLEPNERI